MKPIIARLKDRYSPKGVSFFDHDVSLVDWYPADMEEDDKTTPYYIVRVGLNDFYRGYSLKEEAALARVLNSALEGSDLEYEEKEVKRVVDVTKVKKKKKKTKPAVSSSSSENQADNVNALPPVKIEKLDIKPVVKPVKGLTKIRSSANDNPPNDKDGDEDED